MYDVMTTDGTTDVCGSSHRDARSTQNFSGDSSSSVSLDLTINDAALISKSNKTKGDVLNMKTVKELKVEAKELGMVGFSNLRKTELITAIERRKAILNAKPVGVVSINGEEQEIFSLNDLMPPKAASDSEPQPTITDERDSNPSVDIDEDDLFTDEEPVAVVSQKPIEFVYADHLHVRFKYKGKLVIIGWSKTNFKMHSWSEMTGKSKVTSYASQIKFFKKLKNGVHGDVARVVKSLVRIKTMPAAIKLLSQKSKTQNQNVSGSESQENGVRRGGKVDADQLSVFVEVYCNAFDCDEKEARKDGRAIKGFFDALAEEDHVADLHVFAADYIGKLVEAVSDNKELA